MRFKELDVLRGITALFIIFFHYTRAYPLQTANSFWGIFSYGYLGVSLFFIISGFVIFFTTDKVKSPQEFLIKRFARLYPAYWVCLILTFTLTSLAQFPIFQRTLPEALIGLSMFQALVPGIRSIDGAYWSLLPELMFYILMLIPIILHRKDWKFIRSMGIIWMLLCIIFSYIPLTLTTWYIKSIVNLEYGMLFFAGMVFYQIANNKNDKSNYLLLALTYIAYFIQHRNNYIECGITLAFYGIFLLFIYDKLQWIINKPLMFIGTISYPLYLIHQFWGYIIIRYLKMWGLQSIFGLFIPLIISISLAWLITSYIEKPCNEWIRTRFLKKS